ncbi:kinase-like domain-containing protein [Chytriomyces cf. hyalinus JEL632]|nr:kinase-like domain-containing protein [Chytriomyces cf. hyalinus JEL632]
MSGVVSTSESTDTSESSSTFSNSNLTVAEMAAREVARLSKERAQKGGGSTAIFLQLSDMLKHRYKLLSTIRPSMSNSEVILAYDQILDTQVALKVINKGSLTDAEKWRVLRETGLLKKLSHPNIIKLQDFHETETCYVFVLEYMKDGDLFDLVKQTGALISDQVRIIAAQVALGLRYLHARRVIHRDIKPENIGIRFPKASEGDDESDNHENWTEVKLIDFGLSTYAKSGRATTPCGTLGYMAPEILFIGLHECKYTSAVDMWAFGCLLYILLTGAPPFELGIVPQSKLDVVVSYPPSIWSKVPANAQQAVEACLNPNPETRITAAKFLDLEWFQEDDEAEGEDESTGPRDDVTVGDAEGESNDGDTSEGTSDNSTGSRSGRSYFSVDSRVRSETAEKSSVHTKDRAQKVTGVIANTRMDTAESHILDNSPSNEELPSEVDPPSGHMSKHKSKGLHQPVPVEAKRAKSIAALLAKYKDEQEYDTAATEFDLESITLDREPPVEGWLRLSDLLRPSASKDKRGKDFELQTERKQEMFGGIEGDSEDHHVIVRVTTDDRSSVEPAEVVVKVVNSPSPF